MALVSGGRSSLNPNAPLFVPEAVRQVEDFSAEWWRLITTASWFRDYWLSQRQGEDGSFDGAVEDGSDDVGELLPDSIDLDADEDFLDMEAQFEEFIQSSYEGGNGSAYFESKERIEDALGKDAKMLMKSLTPYADTGRKIQAKPLKHLEKPAKNVSAKCSPRCIQQPRKM